MKVKITQHAEQSMREIAKYIAFDLLAPEVAIKLMLTLQAEIKKLDFMPSRFHLTPEDRRSILQRITNCSDSVFCFCTKMKPLLHR